MLTTLGLTRAAIAAAVVATTITAGLTGNATAAEPTTPPSPTATCDGLSPSAIPCVGLGKLADAVSAECRRVGVPDKLCLLPLSHKVTQAARDAYQASWVHRTAQFQYELGDPVPLRDAQWIGTHNSFNSLADSFTLSQADSNQQLSLTQQLDIDVRSLELDLHHIPRLEKLGGRAVTVCHGQGPEVYDLGCTTEPLFTQVLPQIAAWLNKPANADEVILLYLEDNLKNAQAYASTVATLDAVLKSPNGTSLLYKPDPAQKAANGCTPLPLGTSRDDVRAAGARVLVVGGCAPGWAGHVFDWNGAHVESGSTSAYQAFPACDATYGPSTYATQLVRYFEDTTLVSTLLDPRRVPVNPEALTPAKVQRMTHCGVNVFGFDQLLPEDGRLQASLWSWDLGEPAQLAGWECTRMNAAGRWQSAQCGDLRPAACRSGENWSVTAPVVLADAETACAAQGAVFDLPRTGDQNSRLHAVAGADGAWVKHTT